MQAVSVHVVDVANRVVAVGMRVNIVRGDAGTSLVTGKVG